MFPGMMRPGEKFPWPYRERGRRLFPTGGDNLKYDQTNPLPVPDSGAVESIPSSFDSTFDWRYALQREELLNLYEKGKARSWNASDLDWSTDVDLERMSSEITAAGGHHVINTMLDPPQTLSPENAVTMQLHMNAWMLSQFLHGEQGALVASAKLVMACVQLVLILGMPMNISKDSNTYAK